MRIFLEYCIIPSKLLKQKRQDPKSLPTTKMEIPSFSPKKPLDRFCFPTPPQKKNIRKLSLWKKNMRVIFHGQPGCFPPRPKKKTEFPGNGTCAGLGRGWLFPELFLGAWEKIRPKVEKLHGNLGKHPAPKRVLLLQDFQHRPLLMNPNESHE